MGSFINQQSATIGGVQISGSNSVSGDLTVLLNDPDNLPASGTTRFMVPVDVSAISGIVIASGVDATLKTNAPQVETAVAAGAVTGDGNASVVVTAVGLVGSPLTTAVAVLNGDSASTVGGKIRTALGGVSAITDMFTVGGSGANVTLTKLTDEATDATFNISIATGTATGITAAPTSTMSAAAGDDTIALKGGLPYIWTTDSYDALKLETDVVSMAVVVAGAVASQFQVGTAGDSTPS